MDSDTRRQSQDVPLALTRQTVQLKLRSRPTRLPELRAKACRADVIAIVSKATRTCQQGRMRPSTVAQCTGSTFYASQTTP